MGDIIQPALFIPEDIRLGLLSGLYVRIGGVVRNAKTMALVKLLEDAAPALKKGALFNQLADAGKAIPMKWWVAAGITGTAAAVTVFYAIYARPIRACSKKYQTALSEYLEAISVGTDVSEKISALVDVFSEMQALQEQKIFAWIFPQRSFNDLRDILSQYTTKLAEANHVTELDLPELADGEGQQLISEIEEYLKAQKAILDSKDGK